MLIVLFLILYYANSGLISPIAHNYISLSVANPAMTSIYNFTFTLQSGLPINGQIQISFPIQSYNSGLGISPSLLNVTYNNIDVSTLCTINDRILYIKFNRSIDANFPITLIVNYIINPVKEGGTSNFIIKSYDDNSHLLDSSYSFGSIGISNFATNITDLIIISSNLNAGGSSQYNFSFTNIKSIVRPIQFQLAFSKTYDLSKITSCYCLQFQMQFMIESPNILIIASLSNMSSGQFINCTINNVINPKYSTITQNFLLNIRKINTNFITESGTAVPLIINPNQIIVTASSNVTLYDNIIRTILIDIKPSNPCIALKIVTPFVNITSVIVQYGLNSLNLTSIIMQNIIQIFNFTYIVDITIRIRVSGFLFTQNGNMISNPIQVYTYLDNLFEYLVDYSNTSISSRVIPVSAVTIIDSLTASSSNLYTNMTNLLQINLTAPNKLIDTILLEIPQIFTDILSCKINSVIVQCVLVNESLQISGLSLSINPNCAPCNILSINMINPRLAGTFQIGINMIYRYLPVYFGQIGISLIYSSINNLIVNSFGDIGFYIQLNISDFTLINGNAIDQSNYTHYSEIQINLAGNSPYGCDFYLYSKEQNQLSNAKCIINQSIVTINGYNSPINQKIISFFIYTNNIINANVNVSILQNYLTKLYLIKSNSILSINSLSNINNIINYSTNIYYQSSLNFTLNVINATYYVINYPIGTSCCEAIYLNQIIMNITRINSKIVFANPFENLTSIQLDLINFKSIEGINQNQQFSVMSILNNQIIEQYMYSLTADSYIQSSWSLLLRNNLTKFPYENYTFLFQITNYSMATNGKIDLIFDSTYDFINYPPSLIQYLINDAFQTTLPLLVINSKNNITLSNFINQNINDTISFTLFGILNPSLPQNYTIFINYKDSLNFIYRTAQIIYNIESAYQQNTNAVSLNCYPNSTSQANLITILLPFAQLPINSIISISANGITFNSSTYISSSTLLKYIVTSNTITITLLEIITQNTIIFYLYNFVLTEDISLNVNIVYRTKSIYNTIINSVISTFTTYQNFSSTLNFYPINSAELATYNFLFLTNYNLTHGDSLFIVFGDQYDNLLTSRQLDIQSETLFGPLYYIIFDRTIQITGFLTVSTLTVDLSIFGIQNPNRKSNNPTNNFTIYILNEDYTIKQKSILNGIILTTPPQILQFYSVQISKNLSRYVSTYSFSFYIDYIPSVLNGGQILIDFPQQFNIDSYGTCSINTTFSLDSFCTFRNFRFTLHTNQQFDINNTQLINVQIANIRNPQFKGETSNFIIYIYDSKNQIILSRTYGNVYNTYITTYQTGQQILVNNLEDIYIEKGILSNPIFINFRNPAKLPITLTANILSNQIIIIPNSIQIQIGSTEYSFQVATSLDIYNISLLLNWTKTNDNIRPIYMPLYRNPIRISQILSDILVTVTYPIQLYQNGTSFPYQICATNPPYNALKIQIDISNQCNIIPSVLNNITLLQSCITYQIYCPLNSSIDVISINFTNNQADRFIFNTSSTISSNVNLYTELIPQIPEIIISNTSRTTISLTIHSNSTLIIYYLIGDCGYRNIDYLTIYNKNSSNSYLRYSNPQFGIIYINNGNNTHVIKNLIANHCYQLTFFVVSMFTIQNPNPIILTAITNISQISTKFTLVLNQQQLLQNFETQYLDSISLILALNPIRIISDPCNKTVLNSYLYWNIIILANSSNENINIQPFNLVLVLNNSLQTLQNYISRLVILPLNPILVSSFKNNPSLVSIDSISYFSINFTVYNSLCYSMYYILTNINNTDVPNCSYYQVLFAINSTNQETQRNFSSNLINNNVTYAIENLENNTDYKLEIIIQKPYLQLQANQNPIVLYFHTVKVKQTIDINSIFVNEYLMKIIAFWFCIVVLF